MAEERETRDKGRIRYDVQLEISLLHLATLLPTIQHSCQTQSSQSKVRVLDYGPKLASTRNLRTTDRAQKRYCL